MPDPNFILIGAQKCGTTWLSKMIKQHPEVFAPSKKELHFFNKSRNYSRGIEWYRSQFAGYNGQKAIGEFTPDYFWTTSDNIEGDESDRNRDIPKLVHKHYPNIKFILSLRDPVQRGISAYYHHIKNCRISPNSNIMKVGHSYGIISMGFYYSHLCEWLKFFKIDQFLILIYEYDIVQNKEETIKRVFRFLELDEHFKPANIETKYNKRYGYLYLYLKNHFPRLAKIANRIPPIKRIDFPRIQVKAEEINELSNLYVDENRRLETLIGRRLPWSHRVNDMGSA